MGALDGVSGTEPGSLMWIGTGPLTANGAGGPGGNPAIGLSVTVGGAAIRQGSGVAVDDPVSAVGRLGDPDARDAAWMPPLTELPDRAFQYQIELSVDQETGRVVARVIDRESGEVVRQVPPEYVLQLAMYIDAWLGRVLDARA